MLRLRAVDAEEISTPQTPGADSRWMTMTVQHAPVVSELLELHKPGARDQVVRLGATVTQVAGFGPAADVVAWIADAMVVAPVVIGADALDDLAEMHDPLDPAEHDAIVDRVDELAIRAGEIEQELAELRAMAVAGEDDRDHAAAALALAVEWDTHADLARAGGDEAATHEIDLRARTAALLGRLAGPEPMVELRAFAQDVIRHQPTSDSAVALQSELDRIEAEGRDLVARIDAADATNMGSPALRVQELLGTDERPIVLDGDLLYAVPPAVHDLLLAKLRDAADHRRVVIVFDDTTLGPWLDTVHGSSMWTTGHLHLIRSQDVEGWDEDPDKRAAAVRKANRGGRSLASCDKHPSHATRLSCSACGLPFCSVCLVRVKTKDAVICINCALERGTGVRRAGR